MSKNRGKSKLSNNVLFNANKHAFHCEKSLGTLFYGQPSYKIRIHEPIVLEHCMESMVRSVKVYGSNEKYWMCETKILRKT
jgi:hypothetical protein